MSGSRFWLSCQVNLGKVVPRSRPAAGEGETVRGGWHRAEGVGKEGWSRRTQLGPPHPEYGTIPA